MSLKNLHLHDNQTQPQDRTVPPFQTAGEQTTTPPDASSTTQVVAVNSHQTNIMANPKEGTINPATNDSIIKPMTSIPQVLDDLPQHESEDQPITDHIAASGGDVGQTKSVDDCLDHKAAGDVDRVSRGNGRPKHEKPSGGSSMSKEILTRARLIWVKRPKWGYGSYIATTIVLLLLSTLLQVWSTNTDAPYDPAKGFLGQAWESSRAFITDNSGLFNLMPLTLIYLALVTIINRFWVSSGVFLGLSYVIAIANKCKITARNEPIIPSDLNFITGGGGAGNVAGFVDASMESLIKTGVSSIAIILVVSITLQFIDRRQGVISCSWRRWRGSLGNVVKLCTRITSPVVAISLLFGYSYGLCDNNSGFYRFLNREYGYSPQLWNTLGDAKAWGSLTTFTSLTHVKAMDRPEGYSQETMRKIYDKYKSQADEMNKTRANNLTDSTVVMVLSETFSDPNRLPGVHFDQDVMPLTHETQSTTTAGTMLSPGYGGGTANIEFQAVTGLSMTNFNPSLLSPYQQLVPRLKNIYTFNQTWNEVGDCGTSCSIAIHPFYKNFYLRDSNYKKFGFSEFSTLDSTTPVAHQDKIDRSGYVNDAAAYQEVLDKINADPSKSRFIQLVTMQNHMPYNGEYDNNEFVGLDRSTALTDDEKFHLDSYAKGINHTDVETRDFLNQLDSIDKPITVIFYGDHLPGIYGSLAGDKANEIALHETEYFIWSNRASASHDVKLDPARNAYTSSNYFMAQAAEHMNSRVSPYLAMLSRLHEVAPATTRLAQTLGEWRNSDTVTVLGDDGKTIPNDTLGGDVKTALSDYAMVQYDLTVGDHWLDGMGFTDVPES